MGLLTKSRASSSKKWMPVRRGQKSIVISTQLPSSSCICTSTHPHPLPPAAEKTAALGGDLSYTRITFVVKESELHNQEGGTCHGFFFFPSIFMKS